MKKISSIPLQIEPIEDIYRALDRFDVNYNKKESQILENLRNYFIQYEQTLRKADYIINDKKKVMKTELMNNIQIFTNDIQQIRSTFLKNAPFSAPTPEEGNINDYITDAFDIIKTTEHKVIKYRAKLDQMKIGIDIFQIDNIDIGEIEETEKDINLLKIIWNFIQQWSNTYIEWTALSFHKINVNNLIDQLKIYQNKLIKLPKVIKKWKAYQSILLILNRFESILSLINLLRASYIRPRHWRKLQSEIHHTFDPKSNEFTLLQVISLDLHLHYEFIENLCHNAQRQLNIETSLKEISQIWSIQKLDVISYKDSYYKLKQIDDVTDTLENNQLLLSTMKNSPYYNTFSQDINYWSKTLDKIMEILEIIVSVQRKWLYLENIFMESQEISKQLPQASKIFDEANKQWMIHMKEIYQAGRLATYLVNSELDLYQIFKSIDTQLEHINALLEEYIETKRQLFPRFYFLANNDLLQILGNSKNPNNIQNHINKMFIGANKLIVHKDIEDDLYYIDGIQSNDGEQVKFSSSIAMHGEVEYWLQKIEKYIIEALQKYLWQATKQVSNILDKKNSLDVWLRNTIGQLLITSSQIGWTSICEVSLLNSKKARKAMKKLKRQWQSYIHKLVKYTATNLSKTDRLKIIALITIEVHARDVIDRLKSAAKSYVDIHSFLWTSQLRFYWDNTNICTIKQTKSEYNYGYEYQGNSGRLVITPLTDRCYLTLTTALSFCLGGSPQGPAGTGKTETVKDLGKNLGQNVVVFNCSDQMDVISLGRIFSGLAQTGAWGCFDEFNRILIEVLSVVALQVSTILNAVKAKANSFVFDHHTIKLKHTVGIFITMNPGYAGRTELPENLKAMFRPVAMMVPDTQMIVEMILLGQGFRDSHVLSIKIITVYRLMKEQLSKQSHYRFDLRALKAVLFRAGYLHRTSKMSEEQIVMKSLIDMNIGKLIHEDVFIFESLMSDVFLNLELNPFQYVDLQPAIIAELKKDNLQIKTDLIEKILQLHECMLAKHGNMVVGNSLTGKSTSWKILSQALTRIYHEKTTKY